MADPSPAFYLLAASPLLGLLGAATLVLAGRLPVRRDHPWLRLGGVVAVGGLWSLLLAALFAPEPAQYAAALNVVALGVALPFLAGSR